MKVVEWVPDESITRGPPRPTIKQMLDWDRRRVAAAAAALHTADRPDKPTAGPWHAPYDTLPWLIRTEVGTGHMVALLHLHRDHAAKGDGWRCDIKTLRPSDQRALVNLRVRNAGVPAEKALAVADRLLKQDGWTLLEPEPLGPILEPEHRR